MRRNPKCPKSSKEPARAEIPRGLTFQFVKHRLHLAERMAVTTACRTTDPGLQPLDRLILSARARQGLRRHEIARGVIRIVGQKCYQTPPTQPQFRPGSPIPWRFRSGQSCSSGPEQEFLSVLRSYPSSRIRLLRIRSGPRGICVIGRDCRNWNRMRRRSQWPSSANRLIVAGWRRKLREQRVQAKRNGAEAL